MKTFSFSTASIALTAGLMLFSGFSAHAGDDKETSDQRPQNEMRMSQLDGHSSRVYFDHPTNSNRKIELNADYAAYMRDQKKPIKNADSIPHADLKSMTVRKGPSVGGGGFSDSRGALVYIKEAVAHLKNVFSKLSDLEFENLQNGLNAKMSSRQFVLNALDNIQIGFNEQTWAKYGPNGYAEQLMADYRITKKGSYIVLLRRLLDTYTAEENNTASQSIARIILHEISHLEGVGIRDDDDSLVLSKRFMQESPGTLEASKNEPRSTISSHTHTLYALVFPYSATQSQHFFAQKSPIQITASAETPNRVHINVYLGVDGNNPSALQGLSVDEIATRACVILAARKFQGQSGWQVSSSAQLTHDGVQAECTAP